jgi:AcrR family transcriptional regulator
MRALPGESDARILEKGYDATSVSDLTEAMGINPPSLYAAFGNKESLFVRVLEGYGEGRLPT